MRGWQQLLCWHDPVDDAQLARLRSGDEISGHQQFLGFVPPHQARQSLRSAAPRQETKLRLRQTEGGRFRRHDQVRYQHQFEATTECITIDGGDHGLSQSLEAVVNETAQPLKVDVLEHRAVDVAIDVSPGDEGPSAPRDNQYTDLTV